MQNSKKHKEPNKHARWTAEDDATLIELYTKKKTHWIAKKLGRTTGSVYFRAMSLNLKKHPKEDVQETVQENGVHDVYTLDIFDKDSVQRGLDKLTIRKEKSDGSTAKYYELPYGAKELQHLISHKDMNGQIAEIFRACYRYGEVEHSEKMRDAKKIKFYIEAEIERLARGGK